MIAPTFADIIGEAKRHLEDAEEVLRLPWRGENPTDDELDALDEARGHIATAKGALTRMNGAGAEADAPPRSRKRTPHGSREGAPRDGTRAAATEPKVRSR